MTYNFDPERWHENKAIEKSEKAPAKKTAAKKTKIDDCLNGQGIYYFWEA